MPKDVQMQTSPLAVISLDLGLSGYNRDVTHVDSAGLKGSVA